MDRPSVFRVLRIAVSSVCLLASVLLIVLWVRSYWRGDVFGFGFPRYRQAYVQSEFGMFYVGTLPGELRQRFQSWRIDRGLDRGILYTNALGFGVARASGSPIIIMPQWFPAIASGFIATIPWVAWSRRFSLRALLIATTLVAAALGLIV